MIAPAPGPDRTRVGIPSAYGARRACFPRRVAPPRSRPGLVALVAAVIALLGCGGLQVRRINSAERKPNNVWVFFTVDAGKDDPVGGLSAEDFTIYEDGDEISKFESKQVIQNPEVAAVMYTMLLVDMSGSISESGQADALVDAAKAFAERVGKSQKVGIYAFDGAKEIHSVTPFTEAQGQVEGGLEGLRKYRAKDPSTNLHGAVVEGLRELSRQLAREKKPLKFGTLVVFTDGTDRAARVSRDEMKDEIRKPEHESHELYAIGVGAEIEKSHLDDIGRDGTELATDRARVKEAFDRMASRLEAHMKRFYLLSYCTPARKGDHEVRIEANRKQPKKQRGALAYRFNADGFGPPPDCDPKTPPTFDVKRTNVDEREGDGARVKGGGRVEGGTKR